MIIFTTIITILFLISELLAEIPAVKSNNVFRVFLAVIEWIYRKLKQK